MATLTTLQEHVRDLVAERASDKGLIESDAALTRWINRAARQVYRKALEWDAQAWVVRSGELSWQATNTLTFAEIITGQTVLDRIVAVKVKRDGNFYAVDPYDVGYLEHIYLEPDPGASTIPSFRWYVEAQELRFTPVPTGTQTLVVHYLPVLADMSQGTEEPLAGRLDAHHDLVALVAAQMLFRKDEWFATPWDADVKDGYDDLRRALTRTQGQRTRRIRRASHF
jgi:hypothetical protein